MNRSHRSQRAEKHHGNLSAERAASSPGNLYKRSGGGGGEIRSIEELLALDDPYPVLRDILRPIAVARGLAASRWEDVLQEAFLVILERLDRPDKDAIQRWRSWMRQVMRHKVVDVLRSLHPEIVSLDALPAEPAAPEEDELDQERLAWAAERLKELAEDASQNARLLRGRFVDGRANAELAVMEKLTEKAVEDRIYRLKKNLHQKATENGVL